MRTLLLKAAPGKNDSIVLLAKNTSGLARHGLAKEEIAFVEQRFKDEKKIVILNRFSHWIYVVNPEEKKTISATLEAARKAGDQVAAHANSNKIKEVAVVDVSATGNFTLAFAEGMALGNYQFIKYKTDPKKEAYTLQKISIDSRRVNENALELLVISIEATCKARDLVNEPQSHLNAVQLAKEFQKFAKESGFTIDVFNKARIESLKMGGLLAVNLGSVVPPTFSVMEWKPRNAKNKHPYVLVGKGVVYDTGGLSLKPTPNSMDKMKCDMAGGATVGATMYAIAKAKLPVYVIGLVPATDNRPGGNAYTPGDVIRMHSGLTVEMLNADAEGRMILADALSYAQKYKPLLTLDFATLTGAAAAAIGPCGTVCMGTADEKNKNKLKESGEQVYERLVEFPFWDEYDEQIKSDIAEVKNLGGPYAGAITAGKFLARFVNYPWMHFDIAGPAFIDRRDSYRGKGGTGVGVRLLFDFFKKVSGKSR